MRILLALTLMSAALAQTFAANEADALRLVKDLKLGQGKNSIKFRPRYGESPTQVGMSMYVLAINDISETEHKFSMDFYFRQFWEDPRLRWDPSEYGGLDRMVQKEFRDTIWTPDTFFVNSKGDVQDGSWAPSRETFVRILHSGEVLVSDRLNAEFSCPMYSGLYPFDSNLCYIEIESFGYTAEDINLSWNDGDNSVQISSDVSTVSHRVAGHRLKKIETQLSTGNYTRLSFEILFERSASWTVMTVMVPYTMLLIIAWFTYWLHPKEHIGYRIGANLCVLLYASGFAVWVNQNVPQTGYTKAIDVFTGNSVTLVFLALLGHCLIGCLTRYANEKSSKASKLIDLGMLALYPILVTVFLVSFFAFYGSMENVVDGLIPLH